MLNKHWYTSQLKSNPAELTWTVSLTDLVTEPCELEARQVYSPVSAWVVSTE